jgi:hypothetical protein
MISKILNDEYLKRNIISDKNQIRNIIQSISKKQVRIKLEYSGIILYFRGKLQEIIVNKQYEVSQGSYNSIIFKVKNISKIIIDNKLITILLKA